MFLGSQKSNYSLFFTIPILLIIGSIFYDSFFFENYRAYGISGVDTAIHEGGHLFFAIFGYRFLAVAGGTIMQLLIPLLVGISFFRQKDFFGIAVIFAWLGINLFDISRYAGDAIVGRLPLLMLFGEGPKYTHDWSYMLLETGLIYHTDAIAQGIWYAAITCFAIFFLYSILLMINRLRDPSC